MPGLIGTALILPRRTVSEKVVCNRDLIAHTAAHKFNSEAKLPHEKELELPSAYAGLVREMGSSVISATTAQAIDITKIVVSYVPIFPCIRRPRNTFFFRRQDVRKSHAPIKAPATS